MSDPAVRHASSASAMGHGAPARNTPEKKSTTPDALSTAAAPAAIDRLALALQPLAGDLGSAADLAELLVGMINIPVLELHRLEPGQRHLAFQLSPAAWLAVQECAVDLADGAITSLTLPRPADAGQLRGLAGALAPLADLRHVLVAVPEAGTQIDLSALGQGRAGLVVELDCWRAAAWSVTVAEGVEVRARHAGVQPGLLAKARVTFVDADGKASGGPMALDGQVYHRRANDFEPLEIVDGMTITGNQVAVSKRLNGKGQWLVGGVVRAGDPIVCRNLATWWVNARKAYLAQKEAWRQKPIGEAPRFSYTGVADAQRISQTVSPATEVEFGRVERAPLLAAFRPAAFGLVALAQLGQMRMGESRHFGLFTADHAMVVELQVKRPDADSAGAEYVVAVYDPNVTATHRRTVVANDPARLASHSLEDWLDAEHFELYFAEAPLPIAMLRPWLSDAGAQGQSSAPPVGARMVGFHASDRSAPGYLHAAMASDDAEEVTACLKLAMSLPATPRRHLLEARNEVGAPGLHEAMVFGRDKAVAAFLAAVLDASTSPLTAAARFDLLESRRTNSGRVTIPALCLNAFSANPACVRRFARAVLDAPPASLRREQRVALLTASVDRLPMLFYAVMPLSKSLRPYERRVEESCHQLVREIARSKSLALSDKTALIAASGRIEGKMITAAQQALANQRPSAAAAILCGVLEAGVDTAELVACTGVSVAQVFKALLDDGSGHCLTDAGRLVRALEVSGLKSPTHAELDALCGGRLEDLLDEVPPPLIPVDERGALAVTKTANDAAEPPT